MTETVSDDLVERAFDAFLAAYPIPFEPGKDPRDGIRAVLALRTPPQNTDGEAVAWQRRLRNVKDSVGDVAAGVWHPWRECDQPTDDAILTGEIYGFPELRAEYRALVPASIVDDLRADLTRYIDIATKEATEAESLRAERDALAKALKNIIALDEAFSFSCLKSNGLRSDLWSTPPMSTARDLLATLQGDAK